MLFSLVVHSIQANYTHIPDYLDGKNCSKLRKMLQFSSILIQLLFIFLVGSINKFVSKKNKQKGIKVNHRHITYNFVSYIFVSCFYRSFHYLFTFIFFTNVDITRAKKKVYFHVLNLVPFETLMKNKGQSD